MVDIGAFQSQGFTLTVVAGSTPQAAIIGTAFANPLAVTVAAINPIEPVAGGVVNFTVNPAPDGASASLSAATAIIGSDGIAQVTATANSVAGSYTATASYVGATSTATFNLTNLNGQVGLTFSTIAAQSVPFGTATATFSGTLANGTLTPQGEDVAVKFDGVTQQAVIGTSGTFSTTFNTSSLAVSATPYPVSFVYAGDGHFQRRKHDELADDHQGNARDHVGESLGDHLRYAALGHAARRQHHGPWDLYLQPRPGHRAAGRPGTDPLGLHPPRLHRLQPLPLPPR